MIERIIPAEDGKGRRSFKSLIPLLPFLLWIGIVPLQGEQSGEFKAGAAAANVTPPLGEPIVGGWSRPPATHVHDELYARCLVLDDGRTRIALVVADNVGIPRSVLDEAKRRAHEQTGIAPERILVSATHTHSATSARGGDRYDESRPLEGYQDLLAGRIADGVQRALNSLEPARLAWGSGSLPEQVFNRRWLMKPGFDLTNPFGETDKARMNPGRRNPYLLEPAGPTDPEIAFLSVQSLDGRPIALLANYSLHYVGGVPQGHISADYFGFFARRMEHLLETGDGNPPFVAMMSNGTSGDINNNNYGGVQKSLPHYGRMQLVANQAAAEVFKAYQKLEYHDWVPLGMLQRELELVTRKPTPEMVARAEKVLARPEDAPQIHPRERTYADRILRMRSLPDVTSVPLQVVKIGELAISSIPFEVFVEIGLELKEKTPFDRTFTISLANGSYGYLPTVRHHELGGYETWMGTNRVEIEASEKIVRTLLEMMDQLR